MARRFQTVLLGTHEVEPGISFDVRVLRVDDSSVAHVMIGGQLGPAHASVADARAHAEATLAGVVTWREAVRCTAEEVPCPTCGCPTRASPRYPRALCPACVLEAVDDTGRALTFSNVDFAGGFRATRDDGSVMEGNACIVRGVSCRADEARFGGIVVQPADERSR